MANVSSVSDIKKAIQNKERVLVATNKKTELILLAASKLPAGPTMNKFSIPPKYVLRLIAGVITIGGSILIIGMLRAKKARIVVESGTKRFIVEYEGMGK